MAVGSQQYSVSTTPVLIAEGGYGQGAVWIVNGGNPDIFIGAQNVSSTNGLVLAKQTIPIEVELHIGDHLYAVTSVGTATVSVMQT